MLSGTLAAGAAGFIFFTVLCNMVLGMVTGFRPAAQALGRREDYPMDSGIHKPQMGCTRL